MSNVERIGNFEEIVLLAIDKLKDNAYGTTILETLVAASGEKITVGNLYGTLGRLSLKKLITSRKVKPAIAKRGSKIITCYRLTKKAVETLDQMESIRQNLKGL